MEVLDFLKIKPIPYGAGYGRVAGIGTGTGAGTGTGYGAGAGIGTGDGTGYGAGAGIRSGAGDWFGSGYGAGSGLWAGLGYGAGLGSGYKIKILHSSTVHYVDNIPCIFHSIKGNIAKVTIINQSNYQDEGVAYIAKNDYFFAHGKSIREAVEALNAKYYATLDTEGRIVAFKKLFHNGAVDVKTLHTWHGILTGSCALGRTQFQKEHGLKDDDTLTLDEFIALTQNAYGSHVIEKLKERKE